jgi:hypothetical protein
MDRFSFQALWRQPPAAQDWRRIVAVVLPSLLRWRVLSAAMVLVSVVPTTAHGQGFRASTAAVTLLVTKTVHLQSAVRDVALTIPWSIWPTRVSVRLFEEKPGASALYVRGVAGRLERVGQDPVEVSAGVLTFRLVGPAEGLTPTDGWPLEVRAEDTSSGRVEVTRHSVADR